MSEKGDEMPTVLVTDANRGSAITIIRSLGRQGWRVIVADEKMNSAGSRSRYATANRQYPPPAERAREFVTAIRKAVIEESVDLVIPTTDDAILPLADARLEFSNLCQLAIADDEALHIVLDKEKTLQLSEKVGVPIPQTYLVHTAREARDVAHLLPWPIVVKPYRSRRLTNWGVQHTGSVGYANTVAELVQEVERLQASAPILLQEYCLGTGQGVELLAYRGRPLAAFQHKRLAEVPITGGASALRESVALDPQLFEYSRRLVEALQWTGLIMVEFKVGGDRTALMEVNGRVWGSLPLAVHSGMDFPARLADLYLSGPPLPDNPMATDYRCGVQACNLDLMMLWVTQVLSGRQRYDFIPQPRRRAGLTALLALFDPRRKYDVQTLADPVPGLIQIMQSFQKLGRKARAQVNGV